MSCCSLHSAKRRGSANTLEEHLLSIEGLTNNIEIMQEYLCSEICSSQSAQRTQSANTLVEGLLSSVAQSSNIPMEECLSSEIFSSQSAQSTRSANTHDEGLVSSEAASNISSGAVDSDVWMFGGETVNNRIESSDKTSIWLNGLDPLIRKEKVVTDMRAKTNIILDRSSMWDYLDIPLDVPFTEEDVRKFRLNQRLKADMASREYQRKIFDTEFRAMTEQSPNFVLGQISLPATIKPFEFHLTLAREFSSLCLTAKEPLSSGYFNQIPMAINENILTYLTGTGVLHTRVVWISMRSELNTYDRAYIKDANTARAEVSILDRVAMNLFEQLNNREINEKDPDIFEEWRRSFAETVRLKMARKQPFRQLKSPTEK